MAKRIFIAATMQNEGKTTLCLGLINALKKRFKKITFIKPIGQRYLVEQGYKVDEDSVLIEKIFGLKRNIKDMSPIAIERGFTEKYIEGKKRRSDLEKKILASFERCAKNADLVIIEGTGHAGVGSVFDLSNAKVAKLLDAKVILITGGGIGKPIDEIMLNKALFDKEGVELLGVIINKIHEDKYEKINSLVRKGLALKGLNVLGVLPFKRCLSKPTVGEIMEETKMKLITGEGNLNNVVNKTIVGAMELHDAISYIENGSLIITPGDRDDMVLMTLCMQLLNATSNKNFKIAGIILTGGLYPNKSVIELIKCSGIPVLLSANDTYRVASQIYDLTVKLKPEDKYKINMAIDLVNRFVDTKKIIAEL